MAWSSVEPGLAVMRAATMLSDGTMIDYGLGTRRGDLQGHLIFGHTGNGGGFNNVLEYYPDDDLAIASSPIPTLPSAASA